MPLPKWAVTTAKAIGGHRPTEGHFTMWFAEELTAEQREALVQWWDSWVAPKVEALIAGKEPKQLQYWIRDAHTYDREKAEVRE